LSAPDSFAVPPPPTIPLSDDARKAYQDLFNSMQEAIEGTTEVAILEALNARQADVDSVLTKDAMYRLHANVALFDALLKQINDTNDELKKLQDQIKSIAAGFDAAGQVLAAISKVLTFIPGI
jgi:hypothetical protein